MLTAKHRPNMAMKTVEANSLYLIKLQNEWGMRKYGICHGLERGSPIHTGHMAHTHSTHNNSQHTILLECGSQRMTMSCFFHVCYCFDSRGCGAESLIRGLNVWNGKDQSKAKGLSDCMKSNNMTRTRRALCTSVTIDPFLNLLFQLDSSYQWPAFME